MRKYLLFCIGISLLAPLYGGAQDNFTDNAKKYIDKYATLAMLEQRTNGIPAAVTLGQGILETEAGTSELMTEANNHFGIKCKNGWSGETYTHTDDAPDECFKKYRCAEESYHDHSLHLKRNPRYAPLFKLNQTDYHGWAVCLKKCGYATNPQYAQRLTKIIEDFNLQRYTYSAFDTNLAERKEVVMHDAPVMDSARRAPQPAMALRGRPDTIVLPPQHEKHTVKEGETLASIAKEEGIELKKLMSLNLLNANEEPLVGTTLELQQQARHKPSYRIISMVAHKDNAIGDDKTANGDYVVIDRSKPRVTEIVKTPAKPAATANTPAKPAPEVIIINESKRPTPPPPPKTEEELAAEKKDKELADLKNDLDKIVYADDSKLMTRNEPAAATPPAKTAAETRGNSGKYYTVRKGDTAFSIAKKNNITLEQLQEWNKMSGGDVKVGQTLQVKE